MNRTAIILCLALASPATATVTDPLDFCNDKYSAQEAVDQQGLIDCVQFAVDNNLDPTPCIVAYNDAHAANWYAYNKCLICAVAELSCEEGGTPKRDCMAGFLDCLLHGLP